MYCMLTCQLDSVYLTSLPKTLPDLQQRMNTAIGNVTQDMRRRDWRKWEYRLEFYVSQVGRPLNAFNVTMKLQTFIFQMIDELFCKIFR